MATRRWQDLSTEAFRTRPRSRTIAVLPVAAIEQHGPHLPVAVDTILGEEMLSLALSRLPDGLDLLALPLQTIGKSNEHMAWPGTITASAETLIRLWTEIGESVHRAGIGKLVIVNSHGGNSELIGIVARELRVRLGMLAVTTAWMRFGLPGGVYGEHEREHDIHAGDVETSLMLHFRPDLVDMGTARDFTPLSVDLVARFRRLRVTGPSAFAWTAEDVNPAGAIGNAAAASAEKGRLTAEHQVAGFIELLRDVDAFDPPWKSA